MTPIITQDRKTVNVPNRITAVHIENALTEMEDNRKFSVKQLRIYSINSVYDMLYERFPNLPIHLLFLNADFFHSEPKPIPTEFMFNKGFAGLLSDVMVLTAAERKKSMYYITEKGLLFLMTVLCRLRDEIDNIIFYHNNQCLISRHPRFNHF